jgi:hypothetical protein
VFEKGKLFSFKSLLFSSFSARLRQLSPSSLPSTAARDDLTA